MNPDAASRLASSMTRLRTSSLTLTFRRAASTRATLRVSSPQRMLTICGFSRVLGRPTLPFLRTTAVVLLESLALTFMTGPFYASHALDEALCYYNTKTMQPSQHDTPRGLHLGRRTSLRHVLLQACSYSLPSFSSKPSVSALNVSVRRARAAINGAICLLTVSSDFRVFSHSP